jgi:hypothetical protein
MKTNWSCPKCKSKDAIRVPGMKGFGGVPLTRFARGNVHPTRVICSSCGFVEEYFETREELEKLRKKYGGTSR